MAPSVGQAQQPLDRPASPHESFPNPTLGAKQDGRQDTFECIMGNCGYYPPKASSAMAVTASSSVRMAAILPSVTGSWVLMKNWALLSWPS